MRGVLFMTLQKFVVMASAAEEFFSIHRKANQHDKQKTPKVPGNPDISGFGCFSKFEIKIQKRLFATAD